MLPNPSSEEYAPTVLLQKRLSNPLQGHGALVGRASGKVHNQSARVDELEVVGFAYRVANRVTA